MAINNMVTLSMLCLDHSVHNIKDGGGGIYSQGHKFLTQFVQNRGVDTVPDP